MGYGTSILFARRCGAAGGGVRCAAAVSMLVLGVSQAQVVEPYTLLKTFLSPDTSFAGEFGVHMIVADFNHDGFNDLLASDALKSAGGFGGAGKAFVLFGPTLTSHVEIAAQAPSLAENLGRYAMSVGDANGDGELDVLLGSAGFDAGGGINDDYGRAHLFLGPAFMTDIVFDDPAPQLHAAFGLGGVLGDFDGDGLDDVAVGAPLKSFTAGSTTVPNVGQVWVWNALDLQGTPTLVWMPKPKPDSGFGSYLAAIPSQTGRGEDLLVAAPTVIDTPCMNCQGKVFRFHTPGAGVLSVINPPNVLPAAYNFGHFLSTDDIDGDGEPDLLIGAPDAFKQAFVYHGPEFAAPAITLFSPEGTASTGFGYTGSAADLDRDGHVDLLLGAPGLTFSHGAVRIYWGPEFARMDELFPSPGQGFGSGLATGDVDGDGFAEIFSQSPAGFSGGLVWEYRRQTLQAGAASVAIGSGSTVTFTLDLGSQQAGQLYLAALSLASPENGLVLGPGTYMPILPDGFTMIGLSLLGTPILEGFQGTLDAQGHAEFALHWPAGKGGSLAGRTLHVTAITASPAGLLGVGSNDVELLLEP